MDEDWLTSVLEGAGLSGAGASEKILLVGSSPDLAELGEILRSLEHELLVATSGASAMHSVELARPELVLSDVELVDMSGLALCRRLQSALGAEAVPVILVRPDSAADDSGVGFQTGPADVFSKPFRRDAVLARVRSVLAFSRALKDLKHKNRVLSRELALAREARLQELARLEGPLLGSSHSVKILKVEIGEHARSSAPILLISEPGCGDQTVARAIHDASERRDQPFVKVEGALLATADNQRLFSGQTSSGSQAASLMELADGGTLFLEHVRLLSPKQQTELRHFLEAHSAAAGTHTSLVPDVRVIASNAHPSGELPENFDAGLAELLKRKVLRLPSLVERKEDIPTLAVHYAQRHALRLGKAISTVSEQALQDLKAYDWPGNLRELEDVVRKSIVQSRGDVLAVDRRLIEGENEVGGYRLIKRFGAGGMGEVWKARHELLARPAAVKLIRSDGPGTIEHDHLVRRFQREARVTANLTSPNTVNLYDFGVSDDGSFYYVMELLAGIDLEEAVRKFGAMPPGRVANIMLQACRSLAEAHNAGLVHRDIKPSNLFLCKQGLEVDIVKVLDFGMVTQPESHETRLTQQNMVYGTPAYVSPEGALGERELSDKADIYSLGCVAYWLLVGQMAFEGRSIRATLLKHLNETPPLPSERMETAPPAELENIIVACMAKTPTRRPSALELWSKLVELNLSAEWTSNDAFDWWQAHLPEVLNAPSLASVPPEAEALT